MDGLLSRLEETGVGCHVGTRFVGALAFADDLNLLSPTLSGMQRLVDICEEYANEFNIKFNGTKSQLLLFKGRQCNTTNRGILVNGLSLKLSNKAIHLGHHISTCDSDYIVTAAKAKFWKFFNIFIADYGHIYSFFKSKLFTQYCCSFYGAPLWALQGNGVNSLCTAWRKALRTLWRVHPMTHCDVISAMAGQPLLVQLKTRFIHFLNTCIKSDNCIVNTIVNVCKTNPMSCAGNNYRFLLNNQNILEVDNTNEWANRYAELNDSVNVIKEMIDVRDGYKTCEGFDEIMVKSIIDDICIN